MKNSNINSKKIILEPEDNNRLIYLCGPLDCNIKEIERLLGINIHRYNNIFQIIGNYTSVNIAITVLQYLYSDTISLYGSNKEIGSEQIHLAIIENKRLKKNKSSLTNHNKMFDIHVKNHVIKPRTINQKKYIFQIFNHDVIFGIGPAGTGKTYLAVAAAIEALENQKIHKILLTRPAVEVGEKLGFLPGDLQEKINPYLRPLYDALFKIIGNKEVDRLIAHNIIEIAPLAYMRGRTLDNTFILLDEGQNTTISQMKMFLTRLGLNSKAIITGDITQIDLPKNKQSGLYHAIKILSDIKEISFNIFHSTDAIRHPIVTKIINAYEETEKIHYLKSK
ncbi:PhoH family protein [Blochmannia endosymbiont of Colobopsis nipponica]|nr:PhoH family protein [Blochmannia endosymbiont of Colobopsis nipponica]